LPAFGYSIAAFLPKAASPPLLRIYGGLVGAELALKRALGARAHGLSHDVPTMLLLFAQSKAGTPAATQLTTLSGQLSTKLGAIVCEGLKGGAQSVPPDKYPYIRYLRHASDGLTGATCTDVAINDLVLTCDQLIAELTAQGAI
jgi:hypothetical protein